MLYESLFLGGRFGYGVPCPICGRKLLMPRLAGQILLSVRHLTITRVGGRNSPPGLGPRDEITELVKAHAPEFEEYGAAADATPLLKGPLRQAESVCSLGRAQILVR